MVQASEPPAAPPEFYCPISEEIMEDPVIIETGQTYDRKSILAWLQRGRNVCPLTGKELVTNELVTNWALKAMIASWREGSSRSSSTAAPSAVHYPNVQASGPEDRLAQLAEILNRLKSPSMEVRHTVLSWYAGTWGRFL